MTRVLVGNRVERESHRVHGNLLQKVTICLLCLVPSVSEQPRYIHPPYTLTPTPPTHTNLHVYITTPGASYKPGTTRSGTQSPLRPADVSGV